MIRFLVWLHTYNYLNNITAPVNKVHYYSQSELEQSFALSEDENLKKEKKFFVYTNVSTW